MQAKLSCQTINDTTFISATRFNWQGEPGNWSYQQMSGTVGKITQTYDEDDNNPAIYREETVLTFTSTTTGTYLYREFDGGAQYFQTTGNFDFPWLADDSNPSNPESWYAASSNLADGWRYFDWFKGFKPAGGQWIYHGRHGWLYVQAEDTSGIFLWDVALGRWMYTNATVYPWMYAYGSDGGWVFFFEGGRLGSRFFQRGDTGVVVSEDELSL